jgi:hypothetical protein
MAKYAFVELGFVKGLVDSISKNVHKDLQKKYVPIPEELQSKVKVNWRFESGSFLEPISSEIVDSWDKKLKWIKQERNVLLASTDKYLLPDYPIGVDDLELIKEYRALLRDFPQSVPDDIANVKDVVFPKNPLG